MPSRASYELRIEGVVTGDRVKAIAAFRSVFPGGLTKGKDGVWKRVTKNNGEVRETELGKEAEWINSFFVRPEYRPCLWKADGYDYGGGNTLLSFQAEISFFEERAIHDLQEVLLRDVTWFYAYKGKPWYTQLSDQLTALNTRIGNLSERVRFQQWKWYCGNGGGP